MFHKNGESRPVSQANNLHSAFSQDVGNNSARTHARSLKDDVTWSGNRKGSNWACKNSIHCPSEILYKILCDTELIMVDVLRIRFK